MSESVAARSDGGEEPNDAREESHDPTSNPKNTTVKDKRCQYCHQPFTSSSLGRHLDQYLFKKKPDGIHDVDEIRRLRSTITRRTARNSSQQKQESPEESGEKDTADPHSAAPLQLNPKSSKGYRVILNQPSWHATGVINDIPNSSPVSQFRVPNNNSQGSSGRSPNASHPETVRALELSLQEVLDNIKAASSRAKSKPTPFDFDIQTQTFPALCLFALPPPPSLFSTHPFPSANSFPLNPPSADQYEIVRQSLLGKIQQWKVDQLNAIAGGERRDGWTDATTTMDSKTVERTAQQTEDIILRHLDLSLNYWMSLPPETRRDTWQLEITRAYARESEKHKKAEEQLQRTQQEANYLRSQVENLASCQWPREFALFPPDMLPLSHAVIQELDDKESKVNDADAPRWDYDKLVSKWKRVVMHDKSMGRPGVGPFSDLSWEKNTTSGGGQNAPGKNQNNNRSAPQPNLPGLRGQSPPRRLNPIPPDSPSLSQQQYSLNNGSGNPSAPYATRDLNDTSDSFRPAKRQRTQHEQHRNPGQDAVGEQRLPSISAASTPLSASSPFQPPPNPSNLHYAYHSSASTPSAGGGATGETNNPPYQVSPASDRRVGQSHTNGEDNSTRNRGDTHSYREPSPHPEQNYQNGVQGTGHPNCEGEKIPSLHAMPGVREYACASGPTSGPTMDGHRTSPPGSLLNIYPRSGP